MVRAAATCLVMTIALVFTAAPGSPPATQVDAESVVLDALSKASDVPGQAAAIIALAWPRIDGDPAVAVRARQEIAGFGELGIPYLRKAIRSVHPRHQADVARALLEAHRQVYAGVPPEYPPALEEAAWFGTEEARRVVIPEIARMGFVSAILTIMDAGTENPALLPLCIDALGTLRSDRSRFFLEAHLNAGKDEIPALAASALARIGGRALLPLKAALRSDRKTVRVTAARSLLSVAGMDDVSALAEYVATYPDDDPATVEAVRTRSAELERVRRASEASQSADSAPPKP